MRWPHYTNIADILYNWASPPEFRRSSLIGNSPSARRAGWPNGNNHRKLVDNSGSPLSASESPAITQAVARAEPLHLSLTSESERKVQHIRIAFAIIEDQRGPGGGL